MLAVEAMQTVLTAKQFIVLPPSLIELFLLGTLLKGTRAPCVIAAFQTRKINTCLSDCEIGLKSKRLEHRKDNQCFCYLSEEENICAGLRRRLACICLFSRHLRQTLIVFFKSSMN